MEGVVAYQCDVKKAGDVEFRCYFQLAMMVIGGIVLVLLPTLAAAIVGP